MPLYPPSVAGLTNPMTTVNDIIIGGTAGTPTRLGIGSSGAVLTSNGATTPPSWTSAPAAAVQYNYTTPTSAYSASLNDYVQCQGASFIVTLPTVVGGGGKQIVIQHAGTSLTVYTINTFSGQTVGGLASGVYTLVTNGETLVLTADGSSNWSITDHKTNTGVISGGATALSATQAYVFTVTSANATAGTVYSNAGFSFMVSTTIAAGTTLTCSGTGTPGTSGTLTKVSGTGDATITFSSRTVTGVPAKGGTPTIDAISIVRNGAYATIKFNYAQTSVGVNGLGDYVYYLPPNLAVDTTIITPYVVTAVTLLTTQASLISVIPVTGSFSNATPSVLPNAMVGFLYSSTSFRLCGFPPGGSTTNVGSSLLALSANPYAFNFTITVPIVGWQP